MDTLFLSFLSPSSPLPLPFLFPFSSLPSVNNIMDVGSAAVEEAFKKVTRAAAAIDSERVRKTEEDEERHLASQRLQPAIDTLTRVQSMVEVTGLEEDEGIQDAFDSAKRAIDGAVEVIRSGDLASAKAAVTISLERTEVFEHLAKREQIRKEKDVRLRQDCGRELNKLGQRTIALETLTHMLELEGR